MHCDLVSDYVETPTHEVRAHDTHAQLSRAHRGGGARKECAGKLHKLPHPLFGMTARAAGRRSCSSPRDAASARGLSDVPVPRRGGRRDETGTHVTVDLLRKSGLAVLAVRIAYSFWRGQGRAAWLLGPLAAAARVCRVTAVASLSRHPLTTNSLALYGTGVWMERGNGRCICGPHKLFCT